MDSGYSSPALFDFTSAMAWLCEDIARHTPELAHIEMSQVAVTFAQARRRTRYGLQAKVTPMRFEEGALTTSRYGEVWTVKRLYREEQEILYMLTFYLPRFLEQTFHEKMVTIFHELYHISPQFNGDIRRFSGRCHVHTRSEREYDHHMAQLARRYLAATTQRDLHQFLRYRFRTLVRRHGRIGGLQLPVPKLILVPSTKSA